MTRLVLHEDHVTCPYCKGRPELVTGPEVHPDLPADAHFWLCRPCTASVGCHPGTITPLGTLAVRSLRRLRVRAHRAFDPLWESGRMTRAAAYRWLARELGIDVIDCHIGRFDIVTCNRVLQLCRNKRRG